MRIAIVLASALALGDCATSISVPVTGQIGHGIAAAGEATANLNGKGDFWIQVPGGIRCSGAYDALDTSPTIVTPVGCSDGRTGQLVITRQLNLRSGTAIATLTDGTTGQFVFGDLKFEQAFGAGGLAKAAPSLAQ